MWFMWWLNKVETEKKEMLGVRVGDNTPFGFSTCFSAFQHSLIILPINKVNLVYQISKQAPRNSLLRVEDDSASALVIRNRRCLLQVQEIRQFEMQWQKSWITTQ